MPCTPIKHYPGVRGVVCGPRPRSKPCAFCPRAASRLCDGVTRKAAVPTDPTFEDVALQDSTCDKRLCDRCSRSPEDGKDYCPGCAPAESIRRRAIAAAMLLKAVP